MKMNVKALHQAELALKQRPHYLRAPRELRSLLIRSMAWRMENARESLSIKQLPSLDLIGTFSPIQRVWIASKLRIKADKLTAQAAKRTDWIARGRGKPKKDAILLRRTPEQFSKETRLGWGRSAWRKLQGADQFRYLADMIEKGTHLQEAAARVPHSP